MSFSPIRPLGAALTLLALARCSADGNGVLDAGRGDASATRGDGVSADGSDGDARSDAVEVPHDVVPLDAPVGEPATDVSVIITSDNAYGFGYGDVNQMMNYFGGVENAAASDIFSCPVGTGAESYTVPAASAPVGAYLYIVTWSDRSTTQGVIAQFARTGGGSPIYTGDTRFQVCATGIEYMVGSHGPTLDVINQQIAACDGGHGDPATTSAGWVDATGNASGALAIGEDNSTDNSAGPMPGNEFPVACGIDPAAHWMWFNWSPATIHWPSSGSPFLYPSGDGNVTKQFLIFRLAAAALPG